MTKKQFPFRSEIVQRYPSSLEYALSSGLFEVALERVAGHGKEDRQIALDVLLRTEKTCADLQTGKALIEKLCGSGDGQDAQVRWDSLWYALTNSPSEYFLQLLDIVVEKKGLKAAAELLLVPQGNPNTQDYRNTQISIFQGALDESNPAVLAKILNVFQRSKLPARKLEGSIHWMVSIDGDLSKTQDRVECVEMLLDYGVDVHWVDRQGNQPIHLVHTLAMAQLLIDRGANVREKGDRGNRPLYQLWLRRRAFGPNPYTTDNDGPFLPETETIAVAALLIEKGASWKDAPTVDIMKLQLENHALSEYLIAGRKRAELSKFSKIELDMNPAPDLPKRRPMM